jgi:hypothetical protein
MAAAGARVPVQNPAYASTRPPRTIDPVFIVNDRFDILRPIIADGNVIIRVVSPTGVSVGGGPGRCRAQVGILPADQSGHSARTEGVMAATIGEVMAAWFVLSVPLGIVVGRFLRDQNQSAQR